MSYQLNYFGSSGFAYGDAQTYYFPVSGTTNPSTSGNTVGQRFFAPEDGVLENGIFVLYVAGTLGTNETGTFGINLNGVNVPIETGVQANALQNEYLFTNIGIEIDQGDEIYFYFTSPTWATNPTTVTTKTVLSVETGGGGPVDIPSLIDAGTLIGGAFMFLFAMAVIMFYFRRK